MSILYSAEIETLLISTLLAEDSDFQNLSESGNLRAIMPAYLTIEDVFQRIGFVFRANGYEITVGPSDSPAQYTDDVLFSRTLAQFDLYREKGYDFPSRFLAGARTRVNLSDIYEKVDVPMMDAVVAELAPNFQAKYGKARRAIDSLGPPLDQTNLVVASSWNKYFGVCAKIMAHLRRSEETLVKPRRGYGKRETVAALMSNQDFGYISPMEGDKFSKEELFMLKLYTATHQATIIEFEGKEMLVKPFSAFSAIGHQQCGPPVEHELPSEALEDLSTPPEPKIFAEATVVPSQPTCDAEKMLWDYFAQDFNKPELQALHRQLLTGGRTEAARSLWLGLSKSRQLATARAIPTVWSPFKQVAELMAAAAGVPPDSVFLECAASRILAMKGGVKCDLHNRLIKRM